MIASIGAGVGISADAAVGASKKVVLTTVDTVAKTSETGFKVANDAWSATEPVSCDES